MAEAGSAGGTAACQVLSYSAQCTKKQRLGSEQQVQPALPSVVEELGPSAPHQLAAGFHAPSVVGRELSPRPQADTSLVGMFC